MTDIMQAMDLSKKTSKFNLKRKNPFFNLNQKLDFFFFKTKSLAP